MMMMQMWFYQSCQATILFEDWTTTNCGAYLGAMIACALCGALRQLLVAAKRSFRGWLWRRRRQLGINTPLLKRVGEGESEMAKDQVAGTDFTQATISPMETASPSHACAPMELCKAESKTLQASIVDVLATSALAGAVVDGILAFLAITVALLNMLIAMTYNMGLFLAICIGEAVGVVAFDPPAILCACQRRYFVISDGTVEACH